MGNQIFYPSFDGKREGAMTPLEIPCDAGEVSDGYHTFNELYTHRFALFCMASRLAFDLGFRGAPERLYCWKSKNHWIDGKLEPVWDGWFVAGIDLSRNKNEQKMITYHLPIEWWDLFIGIERAHPPPHDGHTSQDVIERLKEWFKA
jgi:hypothetical protein